MMRGRGGRWATPGHVLTGDRPMDPDATWAEEEFGEADLGDVRRNARLVQLATVLGAQPSASLPDATDDPATLKAAYRFFDNDYVRAEAMLESHVLSTTRRMQNHKQRAISEKEGQKWLTSLDSVIAARSECPDTHFVSVGDREADVYD